MQYNDIKHLFEAEPLIYLANIESNQPHVRAMASIYHKDQLWCCTGTNRPKFEQLKKNNQVEITFLARENNEFHNVRAAGKALEIHDFETRTELAQAIPFFEGYWTGPEDPNFVLYQLDLDTIEYHAPGGKEYYKFDLKSNQSQRFEKHYRRK